VVAGVEPGQQRTGWLRTLGGVAVVLLKGHSWLERSVTLSFSFSSVILMYIYKCVLLYLEHPVLSQGGHRRDKLLRSINIDDLKWTWTPKI